MGLCTNSPDSRSPCHGSLYPSGPHSSTPNTSSYNISAATRAKSWCCPSATAAPVHTAQAMVAATPMHIAQRVAAPVACSLGQQAQITKLNILYQRATCCCHLWQAQLTPPHG